MDITATITLTDPGSDCGGQFIASYAIQLLSDGKSIGSGTVEGWALGAWLAPGACEDIDGSGLDSQPGGWTSADGDAASSGLPRACAEGDHEEPIVIYGGEGCSEITVEPREVADWKYALDAANAAEEAYETAPDDPDDELWAASEKAIERCKQIRASLVKAINEAVEDVAHEGHPKQPTAEEVLVGGLENEEHGLSWGDYEGAGPCIAWRDSDGEPHFMYHPDSGNILAAAREVVAPAIADEILKDLSDD